MKKILTIILPFATLFFAGLLINFGAMAQELVPPHGDFSKMRKTGVAKVVEVIDPMTIKLDDGRFISITGLDFPDLDYYNSGDLAVTAQEVLTDFLKSKKVIIYQTPSAKEGRVNRMNHHIAHLVREEDDIWVQGLLISLGLARVRTTKYIPQMADQMMALEEKARDEKSGMWGMEDYGVVPAESAAEHIGSYQIVEGNIQNISLYRNNMYINFSNDWRDDFTIGIPSPVQKQLDRMHVTPHMWGGKLIRVRGWVESYNGPYIEIDHPESLELLFNKGSENAVVPQNNTTEGQYRSLKPASPAPIPADKHIDEEMQLNKDTPSAPPNLNN